MTIRLPVYSVDSVVDANVDDFLVQLRTITGKAAP